MDPHLDQGDLLAHNSAPTLKQAQQKNQLSVWSVCPAATWTAFNHLNIQI